MGVGRGRVGRVHPSTFLPNVPLPTGARGREELIRDALEQWPGPGITFLEIGYNIGDLFKLLGPYTGPRGIEYMSVDVVPANPGGQKYIQMDSAEYWKTLPVDSMFHVVFVDGCHGDVHADLDVKGALLHLHVNGTLLMHDTGERDDRASLLGCAGPSRAFLRTCLNRPEFEARIDRSHLGGMGIVVKRKVCGRQFLTETEELGLRCSCPLLEGKTGPCIREAFPLYFGVEDVA